MDNIVNEKKYEASELERQKYVDAIVASTARNKIVVAVKGDDLK